VRKFKKNLGNMRNSKHKTLNPKQTQNSKLKTQKFGIWEIRV